MSESTTATIARNATVYTAIESAQAVKEVGKTLVSKKWKETAAQTRMERAVWIPSELLQAAEVPAAFRALVESALFASAKAVLTKFCEDGKLANEIPLELFSRESLVESFMSRGDVWLTKEELEKEFLTSATWKRISSREEFVSSAVYKAAANRFKDTIVKLSGKTAKLSDELCDVVLAKLEEADLASEFGCFVVRRIQAIQSRKVDEVDLSSL